MLGLPTIAKGLKGTTGELCQPAAAEGREIPAAGKPFTLNPVEARDDDSKAFEIWTAKARETLGKKVEGKVGEMVKAEPEAAKIVENEKLVWTDALGAGYRPNEKAFFTVTFYYNESP